MNIVEDISEFLNIPKEDVLAKMRQGINLVKNDWTGENPRTEDEVISFYKKCKDYIFDLAGWHEQPYKKEWDLNLVKIVKSISPNAKTVLDYGCGIGSNGFLFNEAGFDVTLADLESFSLDFAKFVINKYKLNVKTIETDKTKMSGKFDVILCLDTFEHVKEPKTLLENLASLLNSGGKLFLTVAEPDPHHPMHFEMKEDFWKCVNRLGSENKIGRIWVYRFK